MREPEPPPPIYVPPLVQNPGRGICWADLAAEIERERIDRELAAVREAEAA